MQSKFSPVNQEKIYRQIFPPLGESNQRSSHLLKTRTGGSEYERGFSHPCISRDIRQCLPRREVGEAVDIFSLDSQAKTSTAKVTEIKPVRAFFKRSENGYQVKYRLNTTEYILRAPSYREIPSNFTLPVKVKNIRYDGMRFNFQSIFIVNEIWLLFCLLFVCNTSYKIISTVINLLWYLIMILIIFGSQLSFNYLSIFNAH